MRVKPELQVAVLSQFRAPMHVRTVSLWYSRAPRKPRTELLPSPLPSMRLGTAVFPTDFPYPGFDPAQPPGPTPSVLWAARTSSPSTPQASQFHQPAKAASFGLLALRLVSHWHWPHQSSGGAPPGTVHNGPASWAPPAAQHGPLPGAGIFGFRPAHGLPRLAPASLFCTS